MNITRILMIATYHSLKLRKDFVDTVLYVVNVTVAVQYSIGTREQYSTYLQYKSSSEKGAVVDELAIYQQ